MTSIKISKNFASDNCSGVHPEILQAICEANQGHTLAYGDDVYTASALNKFREHFGKDIEVFFVFNGTGANVLSLQAATDSFNAVICADTAHINCDECGAPEKFTGCKLLTIPSTNGKITVDQVEKFLHLAGNQHHSQPKAISITQSTELGTVYQPREIQTIADFAHTHDMFLHMDGTRLANAAASLNLTLREISRDVGVDILSFGGTKNGMMYGEAVVIFNKNLHKNFSYIRKQGMQLASKMRFIAAQFEALLSNDLWLRNARHTNKLAKLLAEEVSKIPQIKITQPVQANAVFAIVPPQFIPALQQEYFFYVWNKETSEVRWMISFDTTEEDVIDFVRLIRQTIS
ncbi:aromatic amino acid beta-eliminating lyase/threonine aldolase [Thermincola ferriacetica]|uniref:Aromatic amino acid beta-eliminating lyase/threonine aldolase n=1 Tax=Thermincola ferriacetica TaxID=281456 RepID=A0A0L6VZR9_9FIRM|nr:low specificity L-threonine aldolase [Thermincola ferriacetica]KNZ68334.1 aromatic amino acid beta-eliminating lyase/threonine aldolase [Thermincola ferriacetica]